MAPDDPLLPVGLNTLARQAGITQFSRQWLHELRDPIEEALTAVGVQEMFARDGALIDRADGQARHTSVPDSPGSMRSSSTRSAPLLSSSARWL